MKKQFYNLTKCLLAIVFVAGGLSSSMAQDAKVEFMEELRGYYVFGMSANGRFVSCGVGDADLETTTYLWDCQEQTIVKLGFPCNGHGVSNDGTVVGNFLDPEITISGRKVLSGGWWKDNVWHGLGGHPDHPIVTGGGGSNAVDITSDGQYIVGYTARKGETGRSTIFPCVWKKDGNGKYVFHKEFAVFPGSAQGARPYRISGDGQRIVGWNSESANSSQWRATMWTDEKTMVKANDPEVANKNSQLYGINQAGTVGVGSIGAMASGGLVLYDDGRFVEVPFALTSISSTGIAVGNGVWSEEFGSMSLSSYLKTFWNLEVSLGTAMEISPDGKYIAGWTKGGPPYRITLGDEAIPTPPLNVKTALNGTGKAVVVTWGKPAYNGETITGYNAWRGDTKLNSELLTGLTFTDSNPGIGMNSYTVTAVYNYESGIKESVKSAASRIEVIGADGCLSPKDLKGSVTYNKTVNLTWGLPVPNYPDEQAAKSSKIGELTKIKPPYVKAYTLYALDEVYPISMGENIYTLNTNYVVTRYRQNGTFMGSGAIGGAMNKLKCTGLAADGEYFYTTKAGVSNGTSYKLIEGTYPESTDKYLGKGDEFVSTTMREKQRITYIPAIDNNNGGFEIGNATESWFYKKDLVTEIGAGLKGVANVCGTAYYEGKIYASIQAVDEFKIQIFDALTGESTNEYIDLKDYTDVTFSAGAKLGGITVFKSTEGYDCLAVVVMEVAGSKNKLVFLKISTAKELSGYNVYRNGTKVNAGIITEREFAEELTVAEATEYTYEVTAMFGDCESNKSLPVMLTIKPIGTCNTPKNVEVEIIRNTTQITWSKPAAPAGYKLLGYNLYRNETKLNTELLTNLFYTDVELALGEYSYQLEAFYDNSCMSSRSTAVNVTIGGINTVSPPTNLLAKVDSNTQVTLSWTVPELGDQAIMKWGTGNVEWFLGEQNGGTSYVANKWDADDLASYFDYTLTDVEFYSKMDTPHTFYIYIDGVKVAEQTLERVNPKAFNLLELDQPVLIEKGKTLMVAYKVTNKTNDDYTIGADKSNLAAGKGDLFSTDGVNWKSMWKDSQVSATVAITIRLAPYSVAPSKAMENQMFEDYNDGNIAGIDNEAKSAPQSIFTNKEVTGYNVYEGDKKLNSTPIKETTYKTTIDNSKNSCYAVEALFTNNRVSAKTSEECIYGECQVAGELRGSATTEKVMLVWAAPTDKIIESVEAKYHSDEPNGKVLAFNSAFTFFALIQVTAMDLAGHENLKLKSIEAHILDQCKLSLVVIQGGKIVIEKAISEVNPGEINKFEIPDGGYDVDLTKDLVVGLKIRANANKASVSVDAGPAVSFRGDIISQDGVTLETIAKSTGGQIDANWNISANFEEVVVSSETVLGYNVYRDGVKINTVDVDMPAYTDETVEADNVYDYHVTTLWNTGCESKASNKINVTTKQNSVNDIDEGNITIFPNPAKNRINIRGEYSSIRMYNSTGIMVVEQNVKSDYIDVSHLERGIYIIELSIKSESVNRVKIVITK